MNKKIILLVVLGLILAGAFVGYRMYNKPHRDLTHATADFTLSATELFADYEGDETAANAKYLDQVIRVQGAIMAVNTDEAGQTSLTLEAGGLMGGVICQMDPALKTTTFTIGQEVTMNGLCTGMLMDVVLVRCVPV
jgi:hypothetical protein